MPITLHDYQAEAVRKGLAELDRALAALIVMPTGTGKSLVGAAHMAEIVRRGGRGLILVHRKEFIAQWGNALDVFGLQWGVEQAEQRAHKDTIHGRVDVVIGSKDTMQRGRLEKWSPHTFSLVIGDEAHHGNQKSWTNVFGHFHSARRLGLTATPERSDDETIQGVFGNVAYELPFWTAVDKGYIAAPLFKRPHAAIDLSALRTSGDDLNQGDLDDMIRGHIEELVNLTLPEIFDERPMLTFTPRVHSAVAMAAGFRSHPQGFPSASVHGESEDRDLVIQQFRQGVHRNLCSCDLIREGTDFPDVGNMLMARPTKSGLVYRQCLGRALRKKPENYAVIVDPACNSGRHDIFEPINLFDASGMDLDILKIAGDLINKGKHQDPRKAIQEADRIHAEAVLAQIQVRERTPTYRMMAYDPFQIGSLLGIPNRQRDDQKPCSAKNRGRLEAYKLDPKGMSNLQAQRLLMELDQRKANGLGTHRQVACLVARGVPQEYAREMAFNDASEDLGIIIGERKRA
jgi:superfamily II DNA or RNA helicase